MSVFELNRHLTRPLKFYEFQYVENHINNPRRINKDYFQILMHLDSKFQDLSMEDIERLTRFVILGEVECGSLNDMTVDSHTFKVNPVRNIPAYPIFVDDNLKNMIIRSNDDLSVLESIFQIEREILLQMFHRDRDLNETMISIGNLKIS